MSDYENEIIPASDEGRTLLTDYCKKIVGTAGGNSQDEIVLYRKDKDASYEIHTYKKHNMGHEIHHAYWTDEASYISTMNLIKKLKLLKYKNKKGCGLCGAQYVVRFLWNGEMVRISTDNFTPEEENVLIQVGNLLYGFLKEKK